MVEAGRTTLRPKIWANRATSIFPAGEEQQEMGLHEKILEERAQQEEHVRVLRRLPSELLSS